MKFIHVVIIFLVLPILVSCGSETGKHAATDHRSGTLSQAVKGKSLGITPLLNSQVCMVNDRFMNKEQIPVPVGNQVYYGCCEGCVTALTSSSAVRFAPDPLTAQFVDKARAFIVLKPGSKDEVLYFMSEVNAQKYLADQ